MHFFACVLCKLELFANLGGILCCHCLESSVNEMATVGLSSSPSRTFFAGIMSTSRIARLDFRIFSRFTVGAPTNHHKHVLVCVVHISRVCVCVCVCVCVHACVCAC